MRTTLRAILAAAVLLLGMTAPASASFLEPFSVSPGGAAGIDQSRPQIVSTAGGETLVTWRGDVDRVFQIRGAWIDDRGRLSPDVALSDPNQDAAIQQVATPTGFAVSSDSPHDHSAAMVWREYNGDLDRYLVRMRTILSGPGLDGSPSIGYMETVTLSNPEFSADAPKVGVGGNNVVTAVWKQSRGAGQPPVVAARRVPLFGQQADRSPITTIVEGNVAKLGVVSDAVGNSTVYWFSQRSIYTRRIDSDGALGPIQRIDTADVSFSPNSAAAVDESGRVLLVWVVKEVGREEYEIRRARIGAGGSVGAVHALYRTMQRSLSWPSFAVDRYGRVLVAWKESDPSGEGPDAVRAVQVGIDGITSPPTTLTEATPGRTLDAAQVAISPAGRATVIWTTSRGNVEAIRVNGNGTRSRLYEIEPQFDSFRSPAAAVAVDPAGRETVAWNTVVGAGPTFGIEATQTDPSSPAGPQVPVDENRPPDIRIDPDAVREQVRPDFDSPAPRPPADDVAPNPGPSPSPSPPIDPTPNPALPIDPTPNPALPIDPATSGGQKGQPTSGAGAGGSSAGPTRTKLKSPHQAASTRRCAKLRLKNRSTKSLRRLSRQLKRKLRRAGTSSARRCYRKQLRQIRAEITKR